MVDCCDIVGNDTVLSTLHGWCEAQFWNKNATKVSSPVHGNVHSLFPTMKMWLSSNMAHSKQTCRVLASLHLPSDLWNNDTGFHPGRCSGAWLNNLTSLLLLATGRERKKKNKLILRRLCPLVKLVVSARNTCIIKKLAPRQISRKQQQGRESLNRRGEVCFANTFFFFEYHSVAQYFSFSPVTAHRSSRSSLVFPGLCRAFKRNV